LVLRLDSSRRNRTMTRQDDERIEEVLRDALPPLKTELERDLWPRMQQRLNEELLAATSWLDWSLAAACLLWLVVFPEAIPALLYHL